MGEGFTKFLKNQTNLSYFNLDLWFNYIENKANIVPFSYIPSFISDNKVEIENYHEFFIRIIGLLFLLLWFFVGLRDTTGLDDLVRRTNQALLDHSKYVCENNGDGYSLYKKWSF